MNNKTLEYQSKHNFIDIITQLVTNPKVAVSHKPTVIIQIDNSLTTTIIKKYNYSYNNKFLKLQN